MRTISAAGAVLITATAATAQPQEKTQIDIKVRLPGTGWSWTDTLSVVHPDFSPVDVEVGLFYRHAGGHSVGTAIHSIIGSPYDPSIGDFAAVLDNPDSVMHPDGRTSNYNSNPQRQEVFHTGTSGLDANRFRISGWGNSSDTSVGGVSIKAAAPVEPPKWGPPGSEELGFLFVVSVACSPSGAPRTMTLDAPKDKVAAYAVFVTATSTTTTSILASLIDTDRATVTVSAPAPASVAILFGAALARRRRRS